MKHLSWMLFLVGSLSMTVRFTNAIRSTNNNSGGGGGVPAASHLQRGRKSRLVSNKRNSRLGSQLDELDAMMLDDQLGRQRRVARSGSRGSKGKGGKGKSGGYYPGGGYEVDVFSDHELDGTMLDELGTMNNVDPHDNAGPPSDDYYPVDDDGNDGYATDDVTDSGILYGNDAVNGLDPTDLRQVECSIDGLDDAYEDPFDKTITYIYTVTTEPGYGLDALEYDILPGIEWEILHALGRSENVMACLPSSRRRGLEKTIAGNVHRLLSAAKVLRVDSDPADAPANWDFAERTCSGAGGCPEPVVIKGLLTATAAEDTNMYEVECAEILPIVSQVLSSVQIDGLEEAALINALPEYCSDYIPSGEPGLKVETRTADSHKLSAGAVIGAALGGMCIVLLGLLVLRQRMTRKKKDENGTIATKQTKRIDDRSAMETTADDTSTQPSRYISPKATDSSDSVSFLGISASPSDCSEWGDKGRANSEDEDTEAPPHKVSEPKGDPDPSEITFADDQTLISVLTAQQAIPPQSNVTPHSQENDDGTTEDPPSDEEQDAAFEPNVREESLVHDDVDLDETQEAATLEPNVREESLVHDDVDLNEESSMHDDADLEHCGLAEA